jgi:hypothetical protein
VAEHDGTLARVAGHTAHTCPARFERWQFKHPKPNDFFEVANEVAGHDLG